MPTLQQIFTPYRPIFILFRLFLLISFYRTPAQQVIFKRVLPPDGSHFGLVNAISQDPQGYMWFATFAKGLHRYDGYHMTTYLNDPKDSSSIASNDLEAIFADHNGIIWIGTQSSGLDRFDPESGIFTHFPHKAGNPSSLSDNRITAILEDHDGTIWAGTMNGLNRLDQQTGNFTRYQHQPGDSTSISNSQVQVLYEDRQGTLWVGTGRVYQWSDSISKEKGGLNCFDRRTGRFTRYMHHAGDPHSITDNRIGGILEDSKRTFWVITAGGGLHTMDRKKGIFVRHPHDPAHPEKLGGPPRKKGSPLDLNNIFIRDDGAGAIWIGASGEWITRYDPITKKSAHFNSFNDGTTAMKAVSGAYTSRDGILWIKSWTGNIYRVDPFQGNMKHFFTGHIVNTIHEDVSGTIWISTFGDGLFTLDRTRGSMKRFYKKQPGMPGLPDSYVGAIYKEDERFLWLGSNTLNRYDRKTQLITRYKNDPLDETSLSKGLITAIIGDTTGSLWIGSQGGLDRFDVKRGVFRHFRNFADSNGQNHDDINVLVKDHAGNLWMGTHHGVLIRFDPRTGKFKQFHLGAISIGSITEDSDETIWVGTTNGLYLSNPAIDSFSRFTDPRIAITATTIITGMIEDSQHYIWVGSSAGIFRFNRKRNEITVYNKHQGVDASTISHTGMRVAKGRLGEFFIANNDGFYYFYPDQFKTNTVPAKIVISNLWLADKPGKPGKVSPLSLPLSQTKKIRLGYDQNFFQFDFAGIHYSSPEDNLHLFMLENLDNNRRKTGPEKKAWYYNVPPGNYTFRVKVANKDGVWAEKAIAVIITPPWWSTSWFRIAAVICIVALIYGVIRWSLQRKFRLQLERSEKEKQLAEMAQKTAELQQQTTELEMQVLRAQMNPHFIFNSLNSINRFILQSNQLQAAEYLTKFSRLVRMILQNSTNTLITLESEIESLRLYLQLEALRFEDHFEYEIAVDEELDISMLKMPPLILQPFVENAIWHGLMHKEEKGKLTIEIRQNEDHVSFKITDDGVGRKQASALAGKSAAKHKSMGLDITINRITMMKTNTGEKAEPVIIHDLVDAAGKAAGTEIIIQLPVIYD